MISLLIKTWVIFNILIDFMWCIQRPSSLQSTKQNSTAKLWLPLNGGFMCYRHMSSFIYARVLIELMWTWQSLYWRKTAGFQSGNLRNYRSRAQFARLHYKCVCENKIKCKSQDRQSINHLLGPLGEYQGEK